MRIRSLLFILLLVVSMAELMQAQSEQIVRRAAKGKVGASQDELVSFNTDVPYSKAIQSLGELSKKLEGKLLIDRSPMQGGDKTIGINIESMYWKDALELILRSNQLWYNDYPEYMEILSFNEMSKQAGEQAQKDNASKVTSQPPSFSPVPAAPVTPVVVDSSEYYSKVREVTISGIFFDVNRTKMAQSGMDFSIFRGSNMNLGVNIYGASMPATGSSATAGGYRLSDQAINASIAPTGSNLGVDINVAIAAFENDALGEVIARPQITVRSGSNSVFQVGQNFSVLQKDFSGNTVQQFYPTGTILTVRPKIYKIGDMDFIDVLYNIEKSTFTSTAATTIINKTMASGSLTLLNGEEGYIGGMYSNDETTVRTGVPFLKDLPWWVFGLRYLFGFDSKQVVKRELIVLLKAEILPSVEERATKKPAVKNLIQDTRQDIDKDLKRRQGK